MTRAYHSGRRAPTPPFRSPVAPSQDGTSTAKVPGYASAGELAAAQLPGLPTSHSAMVRRATKECWGFIDKVGQGGGRLYRVGDLPKEAQQALLQRRINAPAGAPVGRPNGSALAEKMQMLFGFEVIEAVMTSDKSYLKFMPLLKAGIEDRTFVIPFDEGELDDLRMIKMVRGIPKIPDGAKRSKEDGKVAKRHGDNAIADMHLIAAANDDPGDIEFSSAGSRSSASGDFSTSDRGFGTVSRRSLGGFGL